MSKVIVLMLPGTGAPQGGDGICEDFLSHLDPDRFDGRIVPYDATYGGVPGGEPFADSEASGRASMLVALQSLAPATPVVIGGYSQGAVIAGDLAREIADAPGHDGHNIVAVALIADGKRPAGLGVVPAGQTVAEGYGCWGSRYVGGGLTARWVSAWGDPISALPAGNPLRTVADMAEFFAVRSFADLYRWGASVLDKARTGQLQQWWNPANWTRWNSAIGFARGFLFDGRHTLDYVRLGYTKALADQITRDVL